MCGKYDHHEHHHEHHHAHIEGHELGHCGHCDHDDHSLESLHETSDRPREPDRDLPTGRALEPTSVPGLVQPRGTE